MHIEWEISFSHRKSASYKKKKRKYLGVEVIRYKLSSVVISYHIIIASTAVIKVCQFDQDWNSKFSPITASQCLPSSWWRHHNWDPWFWERCGVSPIVIVFVIFIIFFSSVLGRFIIIISTLRCTIDAEQ
jgi:hypothetical protein